MRWKRQRGCLRDKPSGKNSQAERPLSGTTQTLSVMMLWSLLATVDVWTAYFNNIDPRGGERTVSNFAATWLLLLLFLGHPWCVVKCCRGKQKFLLCCQGDNISTETANIC